MSPPPADSDDVWLHCSACRRDLRFGQIHWVCSVSTCNRNRMRLVFCSVACWDSHVADARHRDAWAVEAQAPSRDAWRAEQATEASAARRRRAPPAAAPRAVITAPSPPPSSPAGRPAASSPPRPPRPPAPRSPTASTARS
ncbi:MAG: hypothetical protein H6708_18295 [Kofleriaceae bacterium]|nr:hypothetical protein [Kofleriaceae bacterium]